MILVVEDHAINQQVALLLLRDLGFEAHVAENGRVAVEILSRTPYSLVFMDMQMPEMCGTEACRVIRKKETGTGRHVPIIAMTAHALEGSRESCLAAGMDDYLSKPIEAEALEAIINKWLPKSSAGSAEMASKLKLTEKSEFRIDLDTLAERYGKINVADFVKLFLEKTPGQISEITAASNEKDQQSLLKMVHGLKGVCATVFAYKMRDICKTIEEAARSGDWKLTAELLEILKEEFRNIEDYLHNALI
ncbi:MAG: response regulator [Candidatus Obscuribacterales bacterium]|nr:response regulator [Candidatus Obscuribacterales bacterium]